PLPELDASFGRAPSAATRARASRARADQLLQAVGTPTSYDDRYAVPTFVWAARSVAPATTATRPARQSVEASARAQLGRVAAFYRLGAADVADAPLRYVHDTGRGGIVAAFRQSVHGIDVFRDEMKVLMDRD